MKNRLIILGLGLSTPGTMGGNSKIAIETAHHLAEKREVHFIVPEVKLQTLTDNVNPEHRIHIHTLPSFPHSDIRHPLASIKWYLPKIRALFKEIAVNSDDIAYGCSDFHVDVIPLYLLQKSFGFRWIPSLFLFIPAPHENLLGKYHFPLLKYTIYWFYQRALFALMKHRAIGFVVTNESDFHHFPARFSTHLFAYYGGVNVTQIPSPNTFMPPSKRTYDVIFCSRLHPQKGIAFFLDVWAQVLKRLPASRLAVIGNGTTDYERHLKKKARHLGLEKSIAWLGYVNNEAKYRLYANSRIHVHPTVFDNNGMVAAEALCTGLPVVMQDLPALQKIYTTGCTKVPVGDWQAFGETIITLLSDQAKYRAVAPTPVQIAALREHWAWESRAAEFDNWIDSLMAK